MMKLRIMLSVTLSLFIILCFAPQSGAELMLLQPVTGEFIVYDSTNDTQWVADLTLFTNMTYLQQLGKIDDMNNNSFAGVTGWHLASYTEVTNLFAQISSPVDAQRFTHTDFSTSESVIETYWIGRYEEAVFTTMHNVAEIEWLNYLDSFWADSLCKYIPRPAFVPGDGATFTLLGAWVVTSGAPVPEPATMLLLASGLVGLAGMRRKFKN